jgi:CRP/FNR family transcriptional regulator, nitrogen oxide reductase regulator
VLTDGQTSVGSWRVDHQVFVYEEAPQLAAFVVPFIRQGLEDGAACVYVLDDSPRAEIEKALAAHRVDVSREVGRGALAFLRPEEWVGPYPFDAFRALDNIRARVGEAATARLTGLRAAVEATWTLKAGLRGDALSGWESLLEHAGAPAPLTVVCMYRRTRFDPTTLRRVIQSHGKVLAGDLVYLGLSSLFQNLAPMELQRWVRSARERRVAAGGYFFLQGEPAKDVYVLTEGAVKFIRAEQDGRSAIIRIALPTEPFGHIDALEGTPRIASAQALEGSRALVWDTPTVLEAITTNPRFSLNAIRVVADMFRSQADLVQDLATSRVEQRLARLLLKLAHSVGRKTQRGIVVRLSLSGQDLAEMIGATPYTVSRILAEWRRQDLVDAQRERIIVLNRNRLTAVAGEEETATTPRVSGPAHPNHPSASKGTG